MEKTVSQLDAQGFFCGTTLAYASPLERGVFHIPGGAVDVVPPNPLEEGKRYSFENGQWRAHAQPSVALPQSSEQRAGALIAHRDALLAYATLRIAPLTDALEMNVATEAEMIALDAWRMYRVEVARIDVEQEPLVWPLRPDEL